METKRCPKCKIWKLIIDFSRNKSSKDGFDYYCRVCHRANSSAYQKTPTGRLNHKIRGGEWEKRNKIKKRAHVATRRAVLKGILVKPNKCSMCELECTPQAHHADYLKRLEVVWLCECCHMNTHHGK